jgi:hypothetical protein
MGQEDIIHHGPVPSTLKTPLTPEQYACLKEEGRRQDAERAARRTKSARRTEAVKYFRPRPLGVI